MSTNKVREIREKRKEEFSDDLNNENQLPMIAEEIQARINSTKRHIFRIGELLSQAKKIVGHGRFKTWIEETFDDFSYNTALNFMRVYKYCLGKPYIVDNIKISILYQIVAPDFPEDLRGLIFNNESDFEKIKNRDFADIAKKFKNKKLDIDSPQIKELFKYNDEMNIYGDYSRKVDDCIKQIRNLKENVLSVTNKFAWPTHPVKGDTVLIDEAWEEVKELRDSIIDAVSPLLPSSKDQKIKPSLKLIEGSKK